VKAGDDAGALGLLKGVLGRVSVMDKGARESLINFEKGVGDAAITYENEVLVSRMEGKPMDYVVPESTILIENPVAVVDQWASRHGNEDLARAFVDFLHGPEAQAAYVKYGLRPVTELPEAPTLPTPTDLFTIKDLGGWGAVQTQVFARDGIYDQATQK
jgi:sulfate transport system substrate-binding protein